MSFFDHVTGRPCCNCECEPAEDGGLFCSQGCRDEFEGAGDE